MTNGSQTFARALGLAHQRERRSLRYSLWIAAVAAALGTLRAIVFVLRRLDDLVSPAYRDQRIEAPIYVMGNPRSGTTLLHRLLAHDERFTALALYETLLPSVVFRRAVQHLSSLDERLGGPLRRITRFVDQRFFKGWEGIHDAGLGRPEEDEMLFLYAMRSPAMSMLFPFVSELPEACYLDLLPAAERRRLAEGYVLDLKRHLYASPPGATLLAKNVLAAGRAHLYREAMPDIRVIHILRHPYEAIPSAISMLSRPWRVFQPDWEGNTPESRDLAALLIDYLHKMASFTDSLDPSQVCEIRYEELVLDPERTVRKIYAHFGLEVGSEFAERVRTEVAATYHFTSQHDYGLEQYGLDPEKIYSDLKPLFERYSWSR